MNQLEKCQNLYEELRAIASALDFMEKKLSEKGLSPSEKDRLSREEFRLAMDMSKAYENLESSLSKLQDKEGMEFYINRLKKNAKAIMRVEIIDLSRS